MSTHHPSILHGVMTLYVGIFGKHDKFLGVWSLDLNYVVLQEISPLVLNQMNGQNFIHLDLLQRFYHKYHSTKPRYQ